MPYNIHPILVHFPIAMLFAYSAIKLLPLKRWVPLVGWRDIEIGLLVIGLLGAAAALASGDTAESLAHANRMLVESHSTFAGIATAIYGALLAGEVAAIILAQGYAYSARWQWVRSVLAFAERVLRGRVVSSALAMLGLIAISVTGLLGGVIVYGVAADPFAPIVLRLLGIAL